MPLNLKDSEEEKQINKTKLEPILHKPKQDLNATSKVVLWIVTVIVIVGGMYALIKFGIMSKKKEIPQETILTQSTDTVTVPESVQTTSTPQADIPRSESTLKTESTIAKKTEKPTPEREIKRVVKETHKHIGNGQYTIFIGSFGSKDKAEKSATRWNKDEYTAFVGEFEVKGHTVYRVCLGHFESYDQAKNEAEKLKSKFESGYWIGKIK